jgi:hypothetical protein
VTVSVTMAPEEHEAREEGEEVCKQNAKYENGLEDIGDVVKERIGLQAACMGVPWSSCRCAVGCEEGGERK